MLRAVIWGSGNTAKERYLWNEPIYEKYNTEVIAVVDSNSNKWGSRFTGDEKLIVQNPSILGKINYDLIIVFVANFSYLSVKKYIIDNYSVHDDKILFYLEYLKKEMINKYHDTEDDDILATLEYWKNGNLLCVFNQFVDDKHTYDEVHHDDISRFPYILFKTIDGEERKMFFPEKNNGFIKIGEKWYVRDLMKEQEMGSPHLYTNNDHKIKKDDVLLDVGTCEGNFALRYINVASKLLLFESDIKWLGPLNETFKYDGGRVTVIGAMIGDGINDSSICIDDIMKENDYYADFIKIDIEGYELAALKGTSRVIESCRPSFSVCTYHKKEDAELIRRFLINKGYKTTFSNGYMLYLDSADTYKYLDFRKGVIYADHY